MVPVDDRNLRASDVVAVLDRTNSRGQWVIGRIVKSVGGADGIIHAAIVKVPKLGAPGETTEINRPTIGLALLEAAEEQIPGARA